MLLLEPFKNIQELFKIIQDKKSVRDYLISRTKEWYFSEAGQQAFNQLKTVPDKTMFFYNYLSQISTQKQPPAFLSKIAFVMANSMVNSKLPFAGYPNILLSNLNPFIDLVESGLTTFEKSDEDDELDNEFTALLLATLHGKSDISNYYLMSQKPYLNLNYPTNRIYSDMQKIERDIIWSKNYISKDKLSNSPLCYDILTEIVLKEMEKNKKEKEEEYDE